VECTPARGQNSLGRLVEDKASGTQLIQEVLFEGQSAVKCYEPEMDKVMRLHAQIGVIENSLCICRRAHIGSRPMRMSSRPSRFSKHDDQVD
jgi:phage terminase large subunit-like protein